MIFPPFSVEKGAVMENQPNPVMIIPREKAVFRLDRNGVWYIESEKFSNQKIINYFHSIIKKDKDGFYLEQEHKHYIEKVYFPYEDTPLFVFHIVKTDAINLSLNTGKHIKLDPENLIIKNDNLYIKKDDDLIKFHENALVSLACYLEDADDQYFINLDGKRYLIPWMD